MSDTGVTPPAPAAWDLEAVAAGARAVLRLQVDDVDQTRVERDAATACGRVDAYVDTPSPDQEPSPAMFTAAVNLTVDLYLQSRAPGDTVYTDTSTDTRIRRTIVIALPDRQRWGIG